MVLIVVSEAHRIADGLKNARVCSTRIRPFYMNVRAFLRQLFFGFSPFPHWDEGRITVPPQRWLLDASNRALSLERTAPASLPLSNNTSVALQQRSFCSSLSIQRAVIFPGITKGGPTRPQELRMFLRSTGGSPTRRFCRLTLAEKYERIHSFDLAPHAVHATTSVSKTTCGQVGTEP